MRCVLLADSLALRHCLCRAARDAREKAHKLLENKQEAPSDPSGQRQAPHKQAEMSSRGLDIASQLGFTPISLTWHDLCYYVPAPKQASGAAAKGVVQKGECDDTALVGKKQLLHSVTGALQHSSKVPKQLHAPEHVRVYVQRIDKD